MVQRTYVRGWDARTWAPPHGWPAPVGPRRLLPWHLVVDALDGRDVRSPGAAFDALIFGDRGEGALVHLAERGLLDHVTHLELARGSCTARALDICAGLPRLETLRWVHGAEAGDGGGARSATVRQLEVIGAAMPPLARFPRLEDLRIDTYDDVDAALDAATAPLTALHLARATASDRALGAVVARSRETLDRLMGDWVVGPRDLRWLVDAAPARLRHLCWRGRRPIDVRWPSTLVSLDVTHSALDGAATRLPTALQYLAMPRSGLPREAIEQHPGGWAGLRIVYTDAETAERLLAAVGPTARAIELNDLGILREQTVGAATTEQWGALESFTMEGGVLCYELLQELVTGARAPRLEQLSLDRTGFYEVDLEPVGVTPLRALHLDVLHCRMEPLDALAPAATRLESLCLYGLDTENPPLARLIERSPALVELGLYLPDLRLDEFNTLLEICAARLENLYVQTKFFDERIYWSRTVAAHHYPALEQLVLGTEIEADALDALLAPSRTPRLEALEYSRETAHAGSTRLRRIDRR